MADDDQRDDFSDDSDLDDGDAGTDDSGDGEATGGEAAPEGDAKRIADLISARDKEAARANKAEAALAKRGDGNGAGNSDPATKALMQELREASLDAMFAEFPDLRDYGIERSLIEGTTRAEMRESAVALVGLIKSVSTKARNKTLAEHGIKAEQTGSTRKPPTDYANMSEEDFNKLLDSIS